MTTSTPVQAYPDRRDFTRTRIPPLWEGRRGQITNLWLYAYCAIQRVEPKPLDSHGLHGIEVHFLSVNVGR